MTTADKIAELQKEKFNNYGGRMLKPLLVVHTHLRLLMGDEKFLEFLDKLEGLPEYPKYDQNKSL